MNNYVFYTSVLLNGILLIVLFGLIPFLLYLSVLINLGLLWFIKQTLEKNSDLEEDIEEIMDKTSAFSDHLDGIHELEMYYGDENLQNMINHSRKLINDFVYFQFKYYYVEEEEEDFDPTPEEETPEEKEQLLYEDS